MGNFDGHAKQLASPPSLLVDLLSLTTNLVLDLLSAMDFTKYFGLGLRFTRRVENGAELEKSCQRYEFAGILHVPLKD